MQWWQFSKFPAQTALHYQSTDTPTSSFQPSRETLLCLALIFVMQAQLIHTATPKASQLNHQKLCIRVDCGKVPTMTSNQVTQMIKLLTLKMAQNYGLLGAYGHWIGHVGCLACHKLQPNVDDNLNHTGGLYDQYHRTHS